MADFVPPYLVNEHGDVSIHATREAMTSYLEAIDVDNGEYEFFDSVGTVVGVHTQGNKVLVYEDGGAASAADRLFAILEQFFQQLPSHLSSYAHDAARAQSLHELVAIRIRLQDARRSRLRRAFETLRPKSS